MARPVRTEDEWVGVLTDWLAEAPRSGTEIKYRLRRHGVARRAWAWLVAEGHAVCKVEYTGHRPRHVWGLA